MKAPMPAPAPAPAAAAPAAPGPYAMVDDLVRAVITARGGDAAILDSLPPLDDGMLQDNPDLAQMLAEAGIGAPADEEAMWSEMAAADKAPPSLKAGAIPCADCPDPEGCKAAGNCAMAA